MTQFRLTFLSVSTAADPVTEKLFIYLKEIWEEINISFWGGERILPIQCKKKIIFSPIFPVKDAYFFITL